MMKIMLQIFWQFKLEKRYQIKYLGFISSFDKSLFICLNNILLIKYSKISVIMNHVILQGFGIDSSFGIIPHIVLLILIPQRSHLCV